MTIKIIAVTAEQVSELKKELNEKLLASEIIELHNQSVFGLDYSRIYKYNENIVNELYPTAWELALSIQDFAEASIFEGDNFCYAKPSNRPQYVSEQTDILTSDVNSPIDFKAIHRLLTSNPDIALKHGIKLSALTTAKEEVSTSSVSSAESVKAKLANFIQDCILSELSTDELRLIIGQHIDKVSEKQKSQLLEELIK